MSGGSYDYLYAHAPSKVAELIVMLEPMATRLESLYSGSYAALDTQSALDDLRAVERLTEALTDVFQAIEFHDSGDWTLDAVYRVVVEYHDARSTERPV